MSTKDHGKCPKAALSFADQIPSILRKLAAHRELERRRNPAGLAGSARTTMTCGAGPAVEAFTARPARGLRGRQ
jgi:hypothetical protein